jgi:L-cysteate sulfo-lyase
MAMTPPELATALDALPRFPLALEPTPLEELPGLAAKLGVPRVLVKRDDLTGLAFGGNKVRMLEYFVGDALAKGCDVFVGGGGAAQSNHARLCAAAARKAGLEPLIVMRTGTGGGARASGPTGNRLVTELLGAEIRWYDGDPEMNDRFAAAGFMEEIAADLRARGHRPYVLHSSVHPLGVVAYLWCAVELCTQLAALGVEKAAIVATSEGSVTAALLLGSALLGQDWQVRGVTCRPWSGDDARRVPHELADLAHQAAGLVGLTSPLTPGDFVIVDEGRPAYGTASEETLDVIALCARTDALLLDPVYTGKGMTGLVRMAREGLVPPDATPVFVHTGGLPALFAHSDGLVAAANRRTMSARSPHGGTPRDEVCRSEAPQRPCQRSRA